MLSRVANSMYWMCRYVERAENVARFLSVNLHLLLDIKYYNQMQQWEPMIQVTGDHEEFEKKHSDYSREKVIRFLTFDKDYANSIVSCLWFARENARSIREIISSEMWEQINRFYLDINDAEKFSVPFDHPHKFFDTIKIKGHLFSGLLYSTMTHNEAWHFSRMGLLVERADKISRILDVKYYFLLPQIDYVGTPFDSIQWAATLKSASALEMYRKRFHRISSKNVSNFLIFEDRFPRSIRYCVRNVKESMHRITGSSVNSNLSPAEKNIGRLKADLDYSDISEVINMGMHEFIDDFQKKLNKVDDAINCSFFKIKAPKNGMQFQSQSGE
ncbi:MAG: hypothetical protein OMM_00998 [Candidatus Magnetoglobus multicellularis str. Araruama]|uniref:DUF403 domain-containing protein n=1 Tax=Candidatus Magnetoglobus multicellularis str. Araruama TaxID=890399 RepID=A0A1V1PF29_9BACT|nr:MAG: hypothetical protein OMM_00998 [Candidatus Magnetoglobus multicellularis str. Araruama]